MKMKNKVITVLILGFVMVSAVTALAANPYINVPEQQRLANEARQLWWNSLSSREKHLVEAVDEVETLYHNEKGSCIPVNEQNLVTLMQYIGAARQEARLVYERMQQYCNARQAIDTSGEFLKCAQQNPNWWMTGVCNQFMQ